MVEQDTQSHTEDHDDHSHGGMGKYWVVFGILFVLTGASFLVGSSDSLMEQNASIGWVVMIAISCAKALLVMLFFMHLIWEANWKYVLTIPASIMSIFLLVMLTPDIMYRTNRYSEERWRHAAEYPVDEDAVEYELEEEEEAEAEKNSE